MSDSKIPMQSRKKSKRKKFAQPTFHSSHSTEFHVPLVIPTATLQAHTNQPQPQPQPQPRPTQSRVKFTLPKPTQPQSTQPQSTQPQPTQPQSTLPQSTLPLPTQYQPTQPQSTLPQPTQPPFPSQIPHIQEFSMANETPSSSSSHVSGGNDGNKIMILPDGDGFDSDNHRMVIHTIGSIIRSKFEEPEPSWTKFSKSQRNTWFDIFKSKFTWPPQYTHLIRRSFEYRGSRQMNQIMQEVRSNMERKPDWIGEPVWEKLKEHWESTAYKEKSRINKRNRESMAGASLYTGGSIPHRVHWKRMKQEKGRDPSLTEFYFRTHRKKDNSWVGSYAKSAYEKFEQKKLEISSQIQSSVSGEDNGDSNSMPPDIDIWVEAVGGMKKGRIFGLGSISKTLVASSNQLANAEDIDMIRSQVQALNISLQRQEQEKQKMRKELNDARKKIKEFSKTQKQLDALMQRLGFAAGSSSLPPSSPQHSHDDSSDDQTEEEHYTSFERNFDDYD